MHSLEISPINRLEEKSFKQVRLVEATQIRETHNHPKPRDGDTSWVVIILVPICFMLVCATIGSIVFVLCQIIEDKNRQSKINHCQQIPCSNCRFFSNNHYLKCAVHPSTVLTKYALNCSDYWTQ